MVNSLGPEYQYAKKKIFEEVGVTLTELLSNEGISPEKFCPDIFPKRAGERSLTYQLTDNEGREWGRVEVSPYVSCDIVPDLDDVAKSLSEVYSSERVCEKQGAYVAEYGQLSSDLTKKLGDLPHGWLADGVPELMGHEKVFSNFGNDLESFYLSFSVKDENIRKNRRTSYAKKVGITIDEMEDLIKKVEHYLGPEIINLMEQLY